MNKLIFKSLQFELWSYCSNNCQFCYLNDRSFKRELILERLNETLEKIEALKPSEYHTLGFIGGELFEDKIINDPDIFHLFKKLMDKVISLYKADSIQSIWITANLVEDNPPYLYELCKELNALEVDNSKNKSVWICTSYDTKGRFHTQTKLDNWHKNMSNLTELYPNINKNNTFIATQDFIDNFLKDPSFFLEIENKYKCHIFIKWPCLSESPSHDWRSMKESMIKDRPWFFPKRRSFLDFMNSLSNISPSTFDDLFNINIRADLKFNSKDFTEGAIRLKDGSYNESSQGGVAGCGHPIMYTAYSDSDKCMLCDYLKLKN